MAKKPTTNELTSIPTKAVKKKPAKLAPLTYKQAKFVKGLVEGKTKQQAAMEAYPDQSPTTAAVQASNNLKKANVKLAMAEAFEKAGLTVDSMAKVLKEGMEAKKTSTFAGEIIESSLPDHAIRITAVRAAHTLMGGVDDEAKGGITFNFGNQTFVQKAEINQ